MPVDTAALLALSGIASTRDTGSVDGPPTPAPADGRSAARRRTSVLAAASVGAGLVCGLLLPGPAEADARAVVAVRSPASVAPALLAAPSPFVVPHTPARASVSVPGTSRVAPAAAATAATDPLPPRAGDRAVGVVPTYVPSRPLPARSGTGRRIVYAERAAHLWVVAADGHVLRDYPVTGRVGRPKPGVYHVYSKSPVAVNPGERLRFEDMVRFAVGVTGARIGFHTIPRYADGVPIQSESQLGRAIGAGGCVRQTRADARWLYTWSRIGDTVVVLR